jgi:ABC-type transporter MlaC component
MRALVLLALVAAAAIGVTAAEGESWRLSPKPIRDAVRATVDGQLRALRAEKFSEAYDYAAEGIRRQFTPEVFAAMIRRGYPRLVRHRSAEGGVVHDDGQDAATVVYSVTAATGETVDFRYTLRRESGRWRIAGVVRAERDQSTAL